MPYKTCAQCGEDNPINARVCVMCGNTLKSSTFVETEPQPEPVAEIPEAIEVICPGCKERIQSGVRHCPYCAALIAKTSLAMVTPTERRSYTYSGYGSGYNGKYSNYGASAEPGGCVTFFLYLLSFFIPLVGLIVGGIGWFGGRPEFQPFGRRLFIFSLTVIFAGILLYMLIIARR